jgi:choline monooxygenase
LAQFDSTLPLSEAKTIPASWYHEPAIELAERRGVFGGSWIFACRSDQVAGPGAFATIDVAAEPILIVRGDDGTLRAFANICRHRAAKAAPEAAGCSTKFRCRYHGWTYDLSGRLRGVPEFDGVQNFQRESNGLVPYAVNEWGPWVFVHLGASPEPIEPLLQPLSERLSAESLAALKFVERREYVLACNWKVFVDNYLDGGYHVNTIHPSLAGVLDYSEYRIEVFEQSSLQSSPLRAPDASREDASAAGVRTGDRAQYWHLFPNFMINHYGDVMDTNLVLPEGTDRCRVIFDFYFANPAAPGRAEFMAESIHVADQIQAEDVGVCEEVQRNLHSKSYTTGRFSVRREAAGCHFHQALARRLKGLH